MIAVEDMTMEDMNRLEVIKTYKVVTPAEVNKIQGFIQRFIDHSCTVCQTCPSQIRFAHQRIIGWAKGNNIPIQERLKVLKELEKRKGLKFCEVCDVELEDKRKSYCGKKCKDKARKAKIKS